MSSLAGIALRPYERRIALLLLYIWTVPKLILRLREHSRRKKQRQELEHELQRLRELNQELEAHVGNRGAQRPPAT